MNEWIYLVWENRTLKVSSHHQMEGWFSNFSILSEMKCDYQSAINTSQHAPPTWPKTNKITDFKQNCTLLILFSAFSLLVKQSKCSPSRQLIAQPKRVTDLCLLFCIRVSNPGCDHYQAGIVFPIELCSSVSACLFHLLWWFPCQLFACLHCWFYTQHSRVYQRVIYSSW